MRLAIHTFRITFNQKKARNFRISIESSLPADVKALISALLITTVIVASWLKNSPSGITSSAVGSGGVVLVEALALIGRVIRNPDSLVEESHSGIGLLECPVLHKAAKNGARAQVPDVLMSGDHAKIHRSQS